MTPAQRSRYEEYTLIDRVHRRLNTAMDEGSISEEEYRRQLRVVINARRTLQEEAEAERDVRKVRDEDLVPCDWKEEGF